MMPELDGPGLIRRIRSAQRPGYVYAMLAHGEIPEGGPGRGDGSRRGRLPDQAVRPGRAPGPAARRRADHPPGAELRETQAALIQTREAREPGAPGGRGGPRDQQPARLRRQQPGRAPPGRAGRHARAGQVPGRRRRPGAGASRGSPPRRPAWRRRSTSPTSARTSPRLFESSAEGCDGSAPSSRTCAISPGWTRRNSRRWTSTPPSDPPWRRSATSSTRRRSAWRPTSGTSPR